MKRNEGSRLFWIVKWAGLSLLFFLVMTIDHNNGIIARLELPAPLFLTALCAMIISSIIYKKDNIRIGIAIVLAFFASLPNTSPLWFINDADVYAALLLGYMFTPMLEEHVFG